MWGCKSLHILYVLTISITVMINIITGSINLANGSEPFIAGVETPIFKATWHFFVNKKKQNLMDGTVVSLRQTAS